MRADLLCVGDRIRLCLEDWQCEKQADAKQADENARVAAIRHLDQSVCDLLENKEPVFERALVLTSRRAIDTFLKTAWKLRRDGPLTWDEIRGLRAGIW
jgi:hypothetical protein